MLAIATITNTEQTVYTCPAGKSAFVFVDIFCDNTSGSANVAIKINDTVYYSGLVDEFISAKLSLTANDVVKVSSDNTVNVFIHGMEV